MGEGLRMTDTGQVPGEGLPENAGMVEQPGVHAPGAYPYLSDTAPTEEDDMLLPGAQGAWGNEVPPPGSDPVAGQAGPAGHVVHEPGPHETDGRDSGAVDLTAVRTPDATASAAPGPETARPGRPQVATAVPQPPAARRPLHLGPPIPDGSASPVRSLADRGPAGAPVPPAAVRHPAPAAAAPEYPDGTQAAERAPQAVSPWVAVPVTSSMSVAPTGAETPVPGGAVLGGVPAGEAFPPAAAPGATPPAGVALGGVPAAGSVAEAGVPGGAVPGGTPEAPRTGEVLMPAQGPDPVQNPELMHALDGSLDPQMPDPAPFPEAPLDGTAAVAQPVPAAGPQGGAPQLEGSPGIPVQEAEQPAEVLPALEGVEPLEAAEAAEAAVVREAQPVAEVPAPAETPDAVAEIVPPVEAAAPQAVAEPVVAVPKAGAQAVAEGEAAPAVLEQPAAGEPAVAEPVAAAAEPVAAEPEAPQAAPVEAGSEAVAADEVAVAAEPAAPAGRAVQAEGEAPAAPQPIPAQGLPVLPQSVPAPAAPTDATAEAPVEAVEAVEAPVVTVPEQQPAEAVPVAAVVPAEAPALADAAAPAPDQTDEPVAAAQPTAAQPPATEPTAPEPTAEAAVPAPATAQVPAPAPEATAAGTSETAPTAETADEAGPAATDAPAAVVPEAVVPQPVPTLAEADAVPAPGPAAESTAAPEPAADPGTPGDTPADAPADPAAVTVPAARVPEAPETPEATMAEADGTPAPDAEGVPAAAASASPETGDGSDAGLVQHAEDLDTMAADQDEPGEEGTAAVEEPRQPSGPAAPGYDDAEREAVLRVMRERRDIRNGFRSDPIPHEVLLRVLEAAHTAPSVGHSQPWDFVVIRSAETRQAMHELAERQREAYAKSLPKGRAKQFKELKIEAILDTPVNIVVTADPTRGGRHTLGRHTQPQMAPYSSALAVENLWLAARAEGLGVGWVSFFDEREMVRALGLPEHLEVVAYLCVGYVDEFPEEPELMQSGWAKRRPLSWVVHEETYGRRALPGEDPHDLLSETIAGIRPLDAKALGEAWERQKRMTKPAGALGMLEIISAQLSGLSRQCPPPIPEPAAVAIFAGDHGVHAQGVTPWPQEVTGQMVANFLGGGAVCNAFANQVGAEVCIIDVGVASDLPATPGLLPRKIRPGTGDMTTGPALTREEVKQAIEVGIETARDLVAAGNKALLTGEMGIANTTASAALISVYTETDPAEVTGRGTGINDETLARKTDVVRRAIEFHQPDPADPIGVLAAFGGLEHAAMVGLLLGGASLRTPVILDGVSAGAAALVARAIAPEVLAACIAGHRSAEPGHVAALNKLGLRPLVDLDLRLGEGTGALLALPLVQSTARAMHEVATFDSAGVTEK